MHVILLTVFVSLILVGFFLALFVGERSERGSISSAERDALLPFGEQKRRAKQHRPKRTKGGK